MTNLFSDFWAPWLIMAQVVNNFLPSVLFCILLSCAGGLMASRKGDENRSDIFKFQFSKLLSFSLVGVCFGVLIRQIGGFNAISDLDGLFGALPAIISSLVAITTFFVGEMKVEGKTSFKPVGTASAIFSLVVSYHHYSLVVDASIL